MKKTFGMNKHQKAVYKRGEGHVGKEQIKELLAMSVSDDPADRLVAAENLCPCHARCRIPDVWKALFRMMEDVNPQVRRASWHTIEDGGKPGSPAEIAELERILNLESDPKIRRFAETAFKKAVGSKSGEEMAFLWNVGRSERRVRGKCDFRATENVFVDWDLQTMIPDGNEQRAARICGQCAKIRRVKDEFITGSL